MFPSGKHFFWDLYGFGRFCMDFLYGFKESLRNKPFRCVVLATEVCFFLLKSTGPQDFSGNLYQPTNVYRGLSITCQDDGMRNVKSCIPWVVFQIFFIFTTTW